MEHKYYKYFNITRLMRSTLRLQSEDAAAAAVAAVPSKIFLMLGRCWSVVVAT